MELLYRRVTVNLAQVRTRTHDKALEEYLNNLAARTHLFLYAPARDRKLTQHLPRLLTRFSWHLVALGRYHMVALAILLLGAFIAYFTVIHYPTTGYMLLSDERTPGMLPEDLVQSLRYGRDESQSTKMNFATFLWTHNLKVGLLSLAAGILAGIPTVFLILINGMMLGAFTAVFLRAGITTEYWAWILPHGITELTTIVICGGLGLRLGHAVIQPGYYSFAENMNRVGKHIAWTAIGAGVLLCLAAIIESYYRQTNLSSAPRLIFAAFTAVIWILIILLGVRLHRNEGRAVEAVQF